MLQNQDEVINFCVTEDISLSEYHRKKRKKNIIMGILAVILFISVCYALYLLDVETIQSIPVICFVLVGLLIVAIVIIECVWDWRYIQLLKKSEKQWALLKREEGNLRLTLIKLTKKSMLIALILILLSIVCLFGGTMLSVLVFKSAIAFIFVAVLGCALVIGFCLYLAFLTDGQQKIIQAIKNKSYSPFNNSELYKQE